jgi:hypothetical protein
MRTNIKNKFQIKNYKSVEITSNEYASIIVTTIVNNELRIRMNDCNGQIVWHNDLYTYNHRKKKREIDTAYLDEVFLRLDAMINEAQKAKKFIESEVLRIKALPIPKKKPRIKKPKITLKPMP